MSDQIHETLDICNKESRANEGGRDPHTRGGPPQEDVEDRPSVSTVTPGHSTEDQRAKGSLIAGTTRGEINAR